MLVQASGPVTFAVTTHRKMTYVHNWRAFGTLSHRRLPTQDSPVLERRASLQDRNLFMRGAPVDQETNLYTGGMDIS